MNIESEKPRPVTYADGLTAVRPGDRVSVRLFFRRRAGEVIYVPGISKRRGTYEHNGLTWVGVSLADGWAVGEIVLPETQRLKPSVRFLGRGTESPAAAEATKRIEQLEEEEERQIEADERSAAEAAAKPRPMDWFAGVVALVLQLGLYLVVITGVLFAAVWLFRRLF